MRTNKVDNITNFNGYYRIPNTPENSKFLKELFIPTMEKFEFPHLVFSNRTPNANKFIQYFKNIAESKGGSFNWLINHVKRYNVELPVDNHETITVVTGNRDAIKMKKFEIKLLEATLRNHLKTIVKMLFGIKSKAYIPGEPYYIEDIRSLTVAYNKQAELFDNFLEKNNAVNVNSISEMLASISNEIKTMRF